MLAPPFSGMGLQRRGGPGVNIKDSEFPGPFHINDRPAIFEYTSGNYNPVRCFLIGHSPTPLSGRDASTNHELALQPLCQYITGRVRGWCMAKKKQRMTSDTYP